jgi:transcriptional regulator CtsR
MESPSQQLANRIIKRLFQENLLTEERGKAMLNKLAEGKLNAEDWRLEIELSEESDKELSHD